MGGFSCQDFEFNKSVLFLTVGALDAFVGSKGCFVKKEHPGKKNWKNKASKKEKEKTFLFLKKKKKKKIERKRKLNPNKLWRIQINRRGNSFTRKRPSRGK